jgi:polyferredoxin
MIAAPREIEVSLDGLPDATMKINGINQPPARSFTVSVEPDEATTLKVFVTLAGDKVTDENQDFQFIAKDAGSDERDVYDAVFMGPGARK